ncbi:hypothetical protein B296_00049138 [Ensete ventricosum]|uniref:Uncharacterized protein n=1 Tax=Ensete ventricosum TaxID=4639 RepID=A0A426YH73_ENSVE|nr:hypothetical protein B296_00049138 [Ensete ventricosum]
MYCGSPTDFGKLSINVLVFRWSEANQELSLKLSPRRDSVIGVVAVAAGRCTGKGVVGNDCGSEGSSGKGGGSGDWRQVAALRGRGWAAPDPVVSSGGGGYAGEGREMAEARVRYGSKRVKDIDD